MWHVAVDSVWAEFVVPGCPHRPVPLLDAAPLQCWIYVKPEEKKPVVKLRQQEKKPEEEVFAGDLNEDYGTPCLNENVASQILSKASRDLNMSVSYMLSHHLSFATLVRYVDLLWAMLLKLRPSCIFGRFLALVNTWHS